MPAPITVTTHGSPVPQGNRNVLMKLHEHEAEAFLMQFASGAVPVDIAGPLAMVALAHATMAVHYSPRAKRV